MAVLEGVSHLAAILTAVVAVWAYGAYQLNRRKQRLRLEDYLKNEKGLGVDRGQRSVLHLVAQLGMTDAQVIDAAFRSKNVVRRVTVDADGRAGALMLEYTTGDAAQDLELGRR